jgi:hypothetical protein
MTKGGRGGSRSANNARSNSMNPNNSAFHASVVNRGNQMNPSHTAYASSRSISSPTGGGSGGSFGPSPFGLIDDGHEGVGGSPAASAPPTKPRSLSNVGVLDGTPKSIFDVPHEFLRAVVTYIEASGKLGTVYDLRHFSQADGTHSYLALDINNRVVVFARNVDSAPVVILEQESDYSVHFVEGFPQGTDVNGDGAAEILVKSNGLGNGFNANPQVLFSFQDGAARMLASCVAEMRDLDSDGIMEAVLEDNRWEFIDGLPHAYGVSVPMVYAWRDGHYVYNSTAYCEFYDVEIAKARERVAEARECLMKARLVSNDETEDANFKYISAIINLTVTMAHAGKLNTALGEMEILLSYNVGDVEQRKYRQQIMDDFRSGQSARWIKGSVSLSSTVAEAPPEVGHLQRFFPENLGD